MIQFLDGDVAYPVDVSMVDCGKGSLTQLLSHVQIIYGEAVLVEVVNSEVRCDVGNEVIFSVTLK